MFFEEVERGRWVSLGGEAAVDVGALGHQDEGLEAFIDSSWQEVGCDQRTVIHDQRRR